MIRPVTCVSFLLACASGLYLYQSKHRVQLLDREIEQTVRLTDTMREQTRVLHAEWTLMNDPQRLQALADQFLALKTVAPGQFTSMAELDNRLPAVRPPEPPPPPAEPVVADAAPGDPAAPPIPPIPPIVEPARTVSAPATQPPRVVAERKPAVLPTPASTPSSPPRVVPVSLSKPEARPAIEPRSAFEARPAFEARTAPVAAAVVQPAPPRVVAAAAPASPMPAAVPASYGGSALGMARGAAPPPPRPMPVSASQWVGNGGGG